MRGRLKIYEPTPSNRHSNRRTNLVEPIPVLLGRRKSHLFNPGLADRWIVRVEFGVLASKNMNSIEKAYREFVAPIEPLRRTIWGVWDEPEPEETTPYPKYPRRSPSPHRASLLEERKAKLKLLMKPGEWQLIEWVEKKARELKCSTAKVRDDVRAGKFRIRLRRINQRIIFVEES